MGIVQVFNGYRPFVVTFAANQSSPTEDKFVTKYNGNPNEAEQQALHFFVAGLFHEQEIIPGMDLLLTREIWPRLNEGAKSAYRQGLNKSLDEMIKKAKKPDRPVGKADLALLRKDAEAVNANPQAHCDLIHHIYSQLGHEPLTKEKVTRIKQIIRECFVQWQFYTPFTEQVVKKALYDAAIKVLESGKVLEKK